MKKLTMESFLGLPNNDKYQIVLKTKEDLNSFRKYCRKLDIRRRNGYQIVVKYRINERDLDRFRKNISAGNQTNCVICPSGDCYEYASVVQREGLTYISMSDFLPYDFRTTRADFSNPDNKYAIFLMNPIDRAWFFRQFGITTSAYGVVDCRGNLVPQSEADNYTLIAPINISDQIKAIKHIDILVDSNNLLLCKTDSDVNFMEKVAIQFGMRSSNTHYSKHSSPHTRYAITNGFGRTITTTFNNIRSSTHQTTYLIGEVDFND